MVMHIPTIFKCHEEDCNSLHSDDDMVAVAVLIDGQWYHGGYEEYDDDGS